MAITYRKDLIRDLTADEVDNNFLLLHDNSYESILQKSPFLSFKGEYVSSTNYTIDTLDSNFLSSLDKTKNYLYSGDIVELDSALSVAGFQFGIFRFYSFDTVKNLWTISFSEISHSYNFSGGLSDDFKLSCSNDITFRFNLKLYEL